MLPFPYTPIKLFKETRSIQCLSKSVTFNEIGLPSRITVNNIDIIESFEWKVFLLQAEENSNSLATYCEWIPNLIVDFEETVKDFTITWKSQAYCNLDSSITVSIHGIM